jgi:hypothetical protein
MRAEEILRKRRDRTIAIILGLKEREVDPLLLSEPGGSRASTMLRKVILDQINDFYDMALDVASSGEASTFEFNPEVWAPRIEGRLADIQRTLVTLGESNGNGSP